MNCKNILALALCISLILGSHRVFAQTAEELLPKGIHLEEVKGELEQAIEVYRTIVDEFPDNRPVAAKALLHIGLCYEKLGLKQAQKTYQRLISEFSDQSVTVIEAKKRLAKLKKFDHDRTSGLSIKKLWSDFIIVPKNLRTISPDGRYLAAMHQKEGDLCIMDLQTKKIDYLTDLKIKAEKFFEKNPTMAQIDSFYKVQKSAIGANWSVDGSKLAYFWCNGDGIGELRIMNKKGKVLKKFDEIKGMKWPFVKGWTQDTNELLIEGRNQNKETLLFLFNLYDRSLRHLKKFKGELWINAFLSPDEEYIAYDLPSKEAGGKKDIYILSLLDNTEKKLVENIGQDQVLGWMPDGKRILFKSDRGGTMDAWVIEIKEGIPDGEPLLVKKDLGKIFPLGISQSGAFFYATDFENLEIYLTEFSTDGKKIVKAPQRIADQFLGSNSIPAWSPDGNKLAYISERGLRGNFIVTYSFQSKGKNEYPINFREVESINWDPHGNRIVISGIMEKEKAGIFSFDFSDITPKQIYLFPENESIDSWATWLPNEKQILFMHRPFGYDPESKFMLLDVTNGKVNELDRAGAWPPNVTFNPDQKHLTFRAWNEQEYIYQIPVSGGEREIIAEFGDEYIPSYALAPDGKKMYLVRRKDKGKQESLWLLDLLSGEFLDLGIKMNLIRKLQLHPEGRHLVFQNVREIFEIWSMDNF